jgi:hypothetical protein
VARKAARLERSGSLTPRDRMWAAIRALSVRPFSAIEVQFLANLRAPAEGRSHIDAVESYLEGLARAKPAYLEETQDCGLRSELRSYTLVRDVGVDAPRVTRDGKPVTQGAGNEAMWAAMKVLGEFDHAELAGAASAGRVKVREETAKAYCTSLSRAGYLALVSAARGGGAGEKARYHFVRSKNTGPRAPLISKTKDVIDGNTGDVVYQQPTHEVNKGVDECNKGKGKT